MGRGGKAEDDYFLCGQPPDPRKEHTDQLSMERVTGIRLFLFASNLPVVGRQSDH